MYSVGPVVGESRRQHQPHGGAVDRRRHGVRHLITYLDHSVSRPDHRNELMQD